MDAGGTSVARAGVDAARADGTIRAKDDDQSVVGYVGVVSIGEGEGVDPTGDTRAGEGAVGRCGM